MNWEILLTNQLDVDVSGGCWWMWSCLATAWNKLRTSEVTEVTAWREHFGSCMEEFLWLLKLGQCLTAWWFQNACNDCPFLLAGVIPSTARHTFQSVELGIQTHCIIVSFRGDIHVFHAYFTFLAQLIGSMVVILDIRDDGCHRSRTSRPTQRWMMCASSWMACMDRRGKLHWKQHRDWETW